MNRLSVDSEFHYIVQWFNEWSDLQRDDFVPVLVDLLVQNAVEPRMNGLVRATSETAITDKPMSLFQCRVKLFREWTPKWTQELRNKLKEKIVEIDAEVGAKVISELSQHSELNVDERVLEPATGAENGHNHNQAENEVAEIIVAQDNVRTDDGNAPEESVASDLISNGQHAELLQVNGD